MWIACFWLTFAQKKKWTEEKFVLMLFLEFVVVSAACHDFVIVIVGGGGDGSGFLDLVFFFLLSLLSTTVVLFNLFMCAIWCSPFVFNPLVSYAYFLPLFYGTNETNNIKIQLKLSVIRLLFTKVITFNFSSTRNSYQGGINDFMLPYFPRLPSVHFFLLRIKQKNRWEKQQKILVVFCIHFVSGSFIQSLFIHVSAINFNFHWCFCCALIFFIHLTWFFFSLSLQLFSIHFGYRVEATK